MGNNVKFNVIVPTRERSDTLYHSLMTVVNQDYEDLTIIVSDNFSQDNTKEVAYSFNDKRIKYINTGKRISMSDNWEFALSHVVDGWVMFIGDDDGLYPWALQLLNMYIQSHNVEAISSKCGGFYWPDYFDDCIQGSLTVPIKSTAKLKNSKKELRRVFFGDLAYSKLPWLYNGGVATIDVINRSRDSNGRFFCSQIPDMYSAVALSFAIEKYLFIEVPIAINGASRHSTGCSSMRAITDKAVSPILQFQSEDNIPLHESLINGKSLQMVLYECYLKSWHLHHDNLGIKLEDQLKVAIKVAPYEQWPEVKEQCRQIAVRNNIVFTDRKESIKDKILRFHYYQRGASWSVSFDAKRLGLNNVYDAALASASIYNCLVNTFFGLRWFLAVYFFTKGIQFWTLLVLNYLRRIIFMSDRESKTKKG